MHPATVALFEAPTSRPTRRWCGATSARRRSTKLGIRYLVDPRVVTGTSWLTGANEPGRHAVNVVGRPRLHAGRHDRGGRGTRRATRARPAADGAAHHAARHRDRAHLPARPPVRRRVRAGRARPGQQADPDHHGLLRHRRLPAGRGDRRAAPRRARAWSGRPRSPRPTCTSSRPARASRSPRRCKLGEELGRAGLDVLVDDRPGVSVGVRLTDAELIGIPTIVVVGRRLAEGIVELRRAGGSSEDALDGCSRLGRLGLSGKL